MPRKCAASAACRGVQTQTGYGLNKFFSHCPQDFWVSVVSPLKKTMNFEPFVRVATPALMARPLLPYVSKRGSCPACNLIQYRGIPMKVVLFCGGMGMRMREHPLRSFAQGSLVQRLWGFGR